MDRHFEPAEVPFLLGRELLDQIEPPPKLVLWHCHSDKAVRERRNSLHRDCDAFVTHNRAVGSDSDPDWTGFLRRFGHNAVSFKFVVLPVVVDLVIAPNLPYELDPFR